MLIPKSNPAQAEPGVLIRMMTEQTVDETVSTVLCPSPGCKNHTFYLRSSAVLTGAVQLESAHDPAYTGLWNPLSAAATDVATIGAAAGVLEITFSNRTFIAVRARISTVIAGGNLSIDYIGNR